MKKYFHFFLLSFIPGMAWGSSLGSLSGFNLDFHAGPSVMQSSLEGSGFSGNMASESGSLYSLNVGYDSLQNVRWHFKTTSSQARMKSPTGVSPAEINADRSETVLYSLFQPFSSPQFADLHLGIGYAWLRYQAASNSPVILNEQFSQGLILLAEYNWVLKERWEHLAGFAIYLPHQISERMAQTGFNPSFMGLEISYQLIWNWKEDISFYAKLYYRRDQVRFDGTGDRGATSAIDTRTTISVPVGFKYDF